MTTESKKRGISFISTNELSAGARAKLDKLIKGKKEKLDKLIADFDSGLITP